MVGKPFFIGESLAANRRVFHLAAEGFQKILCHIASLFGGIAYVEIAEDKIITNVVAPVELEGAGFDGIVCPIFILVSRLDAEEVGFARVGFIVAVGKIRHFGK